MDLPLHRHPPSNWFRLFSSQTYSRMNIPTILKFSRYTLTCLWRWNRQSVPKRRHIKFRRRGITQKNTYKLRTLFELRFVNARSYILWLFLHVWQLGKCRKGSLSAGFHNTFSSYIFAWELLLVIKQNTFSVGHTFTHVTRRPVYIQKIACREFLSVLGSRNINSEGCQKGSIFANDSWK